MILLSVLLLTLLGGASDLISFDSLSFDFGSHPQTDNTLTHDFTFTNVSGKTISLSYAVATCSCTKVSWTQGSIAPGGSGSVKVIYRREAGATSFEKFVSVFVSGESKPVVLRISGSFYDTSGSFERDFPERLGPIGAKFKLFDLGNLHHGSIVSRRFTLANVSGDDANLEFTSLSDSLRIKPVSRVMYAGTRETFRYTLSIASEGWGPQYFYATPVIDGTEYEPFVFKAMITDDFSSLSSEEVNAAPLPELVEKRGSFGTVRSGQDATASFHIRNASDSKTIRIRTVFAELEGMIFDAPSEILPGQTARIEVTIPASALSRGANSVQVGVVCDSPKQPVLTCVVTGKLE